MQKQYKIWNVVLGWVAFAIAAATYLLTMEPTASFWDCGEFISSAYKLDVGHPPGAPFFMLMGHFASLFAKDPAHVAMCVNALSAIASALTILFLFWTITALAKKLIIKEKEMTIAQMIGILGAGMVGALAYTFSDTFWFSAVEGEVYASSSLFTAIVFWLILKWDEHADEAGSDKWLILIAYLMGVSIGIHLLNLLTIPAIVLVYYYRRYQFSWQGFFVAMCASAGILAAVLYGIIPGTVQLACWAELLFVNTFSCPFNTGLIVYLVILAAVLVWSIIETHTEKNRLRQVVSFGLGVVLAGIPFLGGSWKIGLVLIAALVVVLIVFFKKLSSRFMNTAMLMITVVVLGYSSYAAIVIRSSADTPMDQNSPDNVFNLQSYLNREQYGDRPLFYGQSYATPIRREVVEAGDHAYVRAVTKEGAAQYAPDAEAKAKGIDRYKVIGHKKDYKYNSKCCMLFPRMYSTDSRHVKAYKEWGNVKGKEVEYAPYEIPDELSHKYPEPEDDIVICPTFGENLRFFISYQCHWMYWRYFMWNFAGRQNDLQGYGDVMKGNWISGIPFIDNARLGDQSKLPTEIQNNKGHNVYFMLPLLLGIIGIVCQLARKKEGAKSFLLTFMLFFLTGLAIVLYLNQTPYQPRERDYAYAGSFYAFCIWIGLGVIGLIDLFELCSKKAPQWVKVTIASVATVVCLGVPALMAQQNWDDHDRSKRYCCRDFGANYLNSIDKEAIIFSNGDNDTFPLWYNQEVEGVGDDARVCNLSYLSTDWYANQMKRPYYKSPALPISWKAKDLQYFGSKWAFIQPLPDYKNGMTVKDAFAYLLSNDPDTQLENDGEMENYIPTNRLFIPINKKDVLCSSAFKNADGTCWYDTTQIAKQVDINLGSRGGLGLSDMMVMEMLSENKWERPIYYAMTVGNSYYQGLEPYFEQTGLAYQITPVYTQDYETTGKIRVNVEKMYDNVMHRFRFGNMNADGVYIDENTMRMCQTHRMVFNTLASVLLKLGDTVRVKEVLDYAEKMLPEKNIPYNETSAQMAELYFRIGERATALKMLQTLEKKCREYLEYESSLSITHRATVQEEMSSQIYTLNRIADVYRNMGEYERNRDILQLITENSINYLDEATSASFGEGGMYLGETTLKRLSILGYYIVDNCYKSLSKNDTLRTKAAEYAFNTTVKLLQKEFAHDPQEEVVEDYLEVLQTVLHLTYEKYQDQDFVDKHYKYFDWAYQNYEKLQQNKQRKR